MITGFQRPALLLRDRLRCSSCPNHWHPCARYGIQRTLLVMPARGSNSLSLIRPRTKESYCGLRSGRGMVACIKNSQTTDHGMTRSQTVTLAATRALPAPIAFRQGPHQGLGSRSTSESHKFRFLPELEGPRVSKTCQRLGAARSLCDRLIRYTTNY